MSQAWKGTEYGPGMEVVHIASTYISLEGIKSYCLSAKRADNYKPGISPKKGTVHVDVHLAVSDRSFTLSKWRYPIVRNEGVVRTVTNQNTLDPTTQANVSHFSQLCLWRIAWFNQIVWLSKEIWNLFSFFR